MFLSRPHICFELWQQFDRFHVKSFLPLSWKELFISIDNSQNRNSGILLQTLWAPAWKCLSPSPTPTFPLSPRLQPVAVPSMPMRESTGHPAPNPATAAPLGRRHQLGLQVEGQRDMGGRGELGVGTWAQGWQKKGSAKMLLETSVSHPSLFWSAFLVMKVVLSDIIWQRISEWTVTVLLILTAHFRAAGTAREMLIILS